MALRLLLLVALAQAKAPSFQRVDFGSDSSARCLDGTSAGYFISKASAKSEPTHSRGPSIDRLTIVWQYLHGQPMLSEKRQQCFFFFRDRFRTHCVAHAREKNDSPKKTHPLQERRRTDIHPRSRPCSATKKRTPPDAATRLRATRPRRAARLPE